MEHGVHSHLIHMPFLQHIKLQTYWVLPLLALLGSQNVPIILPNIACSLKFENTILKIYMVKGSEKPASVTNPHSGLEQIVGKKKKAKENALAVD